MRLLSLLFCLSLALLGCSKPPPRPAKSTPVESVAVDSTPRSVQAVFRGGSVVDFWTTDTLAWKLKTRSLRQDPRTERVWSKPVDLVAYDAKGLVVARILADSGTMDRGMRFFRAWGHVVGSNSGGMELKTDSIVFDKESDRIHTSAQVRVKTETGDVLTGKGFRSDAYLNRWEILSNVKGEFRDLKAFPFGELK
jgi:LPS export ABC transporter protein LptC